MPIEFRCTQCGKLLRTPDGTGGQQAKCPACGAVVAVPEASQAPMGDSAAGGEDPFGGAPSHGWGDSVNPYEAPAETTWGTTPFGPAASVGGVRPTRIDFGEVLSQTWKIFADQWAMCLGVAVVCFAINFVVGQIAQLTLQVLVAAAGPGGLVVGIAIYIAAQVFGLWINAGQTIFFINTARGRPAEFANIFAGGPYLLRLIGGGILFGLAVIGIFAVCAGPGALVGSLAGGEGAAAGLALGAFIGVIGAIVFSLTFFPYYYLIIDQNLGVMDSFSEARRITSGNKLTAFAIFLVTGIVGGLIALFTCFIGLLAVIPYMALLVPVMYLLMIGQATAAQRLQQAGYGPGPSG